MTVHRISVIMPCHNGASHLRRGVDSVLKQTYGSVELIVVNDGSTYDSLDILTGIRDDRLKIISQSKQGVSTARNRGLTKATGAFVAFLDADDTWRPDCLERLLASLVGVPEAVVAYCGWQNVGLEGGRGEPYFPLDYEAYGKLEHFHRYCPWPIHAALTRRQDLDGLRFEDRLTHAEK
jgi:glycosyltransferase involved in cell wall biosynthesis